LRRTAPLLLTAALAAIALGPATAQASVPKPAASCYGWYYNYTINSSRIEAKLTWACPGTPEPSTWIYLQRLSPTGGSTYVTDINSTGSSHDDLVYYCDGTTPNTYEVGPIFTAPSGAYSFYTFTDNCG
jgi:hypothetical protein